METSKLCMLFLFSCMFLHAAMADFECEELPTDACAFAVSSSGKRCLLETSNQGTTDYQCRTSDVVVQRFVNYIENDQWINDCGLERNTVGISSDSLLESRLTAKLCSDSCFQNCPNVVDLYFNLADGEGAYLPEICRASRVNPHRSMIQLMSSGAAPAPISSQQFLVIDTGADTAPALAPAPSPASV